MNVRRLHASYFGNGQNDLTEHKSLPWAAETARRKRRAPGAPCLWQETLLRKLAICGRLDVAKLSSSPGLGRICSPPLSAGLLFAGSGVSASPESGPPAGHSPRRG